MNDLVVLLNQIANSDDQTYVRDGGLMEVSPEGFPTLKTLLENNSVQSTTEYGLVKINLDSSPNIYFDKQHFYSTYSPVENLDECDFHIVNEQGKYLHREKFEDFDNENLFIENFHFYSKLLKLLTSPSAFCDYHKETDREIILMDTDDKAAVLVGYNPLDERVEELDNLGKSYNRLEEFFSKVEFQKLFKESVLISLKGKSKDDRFFEITKNLDIYLDRAEADYINHLRNFSFKKIQSQFKEQRTKYFQEIENNLDLINKQILAFPLTFSATAFASYQVKDNYVILVLIGVAYTLYTIVAWKTLTIAKVNLENVSSDVEHESDNIKSINLATYEKFETDFNKIRNKIRKLETLILWLRVILFALLFLFIIYFVHTSLIESEQNRIDSILT